MTARESRHGKVRTALGDGIPVPDRLGACGREVVFEPGARVLNPENVRIGDRTYVGHDAHLDGYHDGSLEVGADCWIGAGCFLHGAGGLFIGDSVGIAPGVVVITSEHQETDPGIPVLAERIAMAPVRIGSGADVGARAVILPGVTVGERAVIGAGAVVTTDVEAETVVAGVPARKMRRRAARTEGSDAE